MQANELQSIPTVAKKFHAPADTSTHARPPISTFARLRRWYRHSALRLLVAEIRALGHRSRWALQIREVELLRGKDSVRMWMDDSLVGGPQSYKLAYICYMQQIEERFPFVSISDLLLLAQVWKAGSEWNGRKDTSQSQDRSCDQFS
jgi:hypothetical protein